jgi:hypothetical protein
MEKVIENGFQKVQKMIDRKLIEIEDMRKYQKWYEENKERAIQNLSKIKEILHKSGFKNPVYEDWKGNYYNPFIDPKGEQPAFNVHFKCTFKKYIYRPYESTKRFETIQDKFASKASKLEENLTKELGFETSIDCNPFSITKRNSDPEDNELEIIVSFK